MNMDFYSEAFSHRNVSEQLHETPWWRSLMANEKFREALERNYHTRLMLGDSRYIKKLLRSEQERQTFIEQVFHPSPDHLVNHQYDANQGV